MGGRREGGVMRRREGGEKREAVFRIGGVSVRGHWLVRQFLPRWYWDLHRQRQRQRERSLLGGRGLAAQVQI